jgi:hypothetical protein
MNKQINGIDVTINSQELLRVIQPLEPVFETQGPLIDGLVLLKHYDRLLELLQSLPPSPTKDDLYLLIDGFLGDWEAFASLDYRISVIGVTYP